MYVKGIIVCLLSVICSGLFGSSAHAFAIAGCLDKQAKASGIAYDLSKPETLIDPIIKCHTVDGIDSAEAEDAAKIINGIVNNYALTLYGEAIAVRANMIKPDNETDSTISDAAGEVAEKLGGEKVANAIGTAKKIIDKFMAKNKREIVRKKATPYKEISQYISKIIELEAQIANLEAARVITKYGNRGEDPQQTGEKK